MARFFRYLSFEPLVENANFPQFLNMNAIDAVGPIVGALFFIWAMRKVREPFRRDLNAILVIGVTGAYLSGGGFGVWELSYPILTTPISLRALRSYRFIGIGWWCHSAWDFAHHVWGQPIWPFMATSSLGCLFFDAVIGVWLFTLKEPA